MSLKACASDWQHQHLLEACWKCTFSGPTSDPLNQKLWGGTPPIPTSNLCFHKLFTWFLSGLRTTDVGSFWFQSILLISHRKLRIIKVALLQLLLYVLPKRARTFATSRAIAGNTIPKRFQVECTSFFGIESQRMGKIFTGEYDWVLGVWGRLRLFRRMDN